MKRTFILAARLLALNIVYFVCFAAVSGSLLSVPEQQPSDAESRTMLLALIAVGFLNSAVLTHVILRSRLAGWRLMLTVFVILFGVVTVMPQIETAVFLTKLPAGMLPRLFISGAVFSALFAPVAVLILGKARGRALAVNNFGLGMTPREWIWKSVLIAAAYVAIYFSFGYFIAWRSPAVRAYYGGTDPGNFLAQMKTVLMDTPWLPLLQILRAGLWMALAVPVIRMMKGHWWEGGLAVALLFGVVMNSQLLLPNPLMPPAVRLAHLLETATSNFLFGWIIVWLLHARRSDESHRSGSESDAA